MAILTKPAEVSSHYYTREGKPMHTMPLADGSGTRPTHKGDARKLGLYPSVSTILGLMAKPGLERWKHKEIALASMRLTRKGEETNDYFANRIIEEAFKQVDDAANLGAVIHRELERFWSHDWSRPFEPNPKVATYVAPVVNWMIAKDIHVENPEAVVVNHAYGFAGTSDCPFRWKKGTGIGVIDYKSRKTTPGEPIEVYDGQATQIAAYGATYWGEQNLKYCWGANIFISTTEPGRVDLVMYRPEMIMAEFEVFKHICAVYRHYNQWDPRVMPSEPQPVFYSGTPIKISEPVANVSLPSSMANPQMGAGTPPPPLPASTSAASSTAAPAPQPTSAPSPATSAAPNQGAFDTTNVIDKRLQLALSASMKITNCDNIDFLPVDVCHEMQMQHVKIKSDYAYWVKEYTETPGVPPQSHLKVGLRNDAAMREAGWQQVCHAYAKDLDQVEQAAGKNPPPTGTNGLPVKPAGAAVRPGPKVTKGDLKNMQAPDVKEEMKATKKKNKIADQARLVQLEAYKIPFGKHRGDTLKETDDNYLVWLDGQPSVLAKYPELSEYLSRSDVRKALKLDPK